MVVWLTPVRIVVAPGLRTKTVGPPVGWVVGWPDGCVGCDVGWLDGPSLGCAVGCCDGWRVGCCDGWPLGCV